MVSYTSLLYSCTVFLTTYNHYLQVCLWFHTPHCCTAVQYFSQPITTISRSVYGFIHLTAVQLYSISHNLLPLSPGLSMVSYTSLLYSCAVFLTTYNHYLQVCLWFHTPHCCTAVQYFSQPIATISRSVYSFIHLTAVQLCSISAPPSPRSPWHEVKNYQGTKRETL